MILVDGQQRGGDVVDENHAQHNQQQPRETAESDAFERRNVEAVGDERGGLREEHRPHEDHQPGGKEPHDELHAATEVDPGRLGRARAVVAQGNDPGRENMGRPIRIPPKVTTETQPDRRLHRARHRKSGRAPQC